MKKTLTEIEKLRYEMARIAIQLNLNNKIPGLGKKTPTMENLRLCAKKSKGWTALGKKLVDAAYLQNRKLGSYEASFSSVRKARSILDLTTRI